MLPGEKVTHIWKMINPSEANAWPKGVCAKSVGGDDFVIQTREWNPSAIVESKATVDIVVDAIAPEKPGRYIHYWRLHDSNNAPFGDRIWLDMTVVLEKPALKKEEAPPAPSSMRKESDDELTAALIGKLLEEDSKRIAEEKVANVKKAASVDLKEEELVVLPESENNVAIGVEESKNGEQEDDVDKKVAAIPAKEEEEEKKMTALEHVEKVSNLPNISKLDSDAVSTTSSTSTSMSNPDEQWDLLHSSSFTEDFTTTAESMMQVQKYQTQLDQLSAMGFSNRDALIKLLDEHQGDVQKVINTFVSSK